jgi:hypothetical protein
MLVPSAVPLDATSTHLPLFVLTIPCSCRGRIGALPGASRDHTVRVWHDLARATLDDPRLWAATNYCMPVERRLKLLGVSEDQARRDRQSCVERVQRACGSTRSSPTVRCTTTPGR